ncbi:hypothetical protein HDV05_006091 [Chytridiales sp. JEL 0842]|nr:hypothetical protein HDV05_006091 [Chytridiales sp. JEL 0842]
MNISLILNIPRRLLHRRPPPLSASSSSSSQCLSTSLFRSPPKIRHNIRCLTTAHQPTPKAPRRPRPIQHPLITISKLLRSSDALLPSASYSPHDQGRIDPQKPKQAGQKEKKPTESNPVVNIPEIQKLNTDQIWALLDALPTYSPVEKSYTYTQQFTQMSALQWGLGKVMACRRACITELFLRMDNAGGIRESEQPDFSFPEMEKMLLSNHGLPSLPDAVCFEVLLRWGVRTRGLEGALDTLERMTKVGGWGGWGNMVELIKLAHALGAKTQEEGSKVGGGVERVVERVREAVHSALCSQGSEPFAASNIPTPLLPGIATTSSIKTAETEAAAASEAMQQIIYSRFAFHIPDTDLLEFYKALRGRNFNPPNFPFPQDPQNFRPYILQLLSNTHKLHPHHATDFFNTLLRAFLLLRSLSFDVIDLILWTHFHPLQPKLIEPNLAKLLKELKNSASILAQARLQFSTFLLDLRASELKSVSFSDVLELAIKLRSPHGILRVFRILFREPKERVFAPGISSMIPKPRAVNSTTLDRAFSILIESSRNSKEGLETTFETYAQLLKVGIQPWTPTMDLLLRFAGRRNQVGFVHSLGELLGGLPNGERLYAHFKLTLHPFLGLAEFCLEKGKAELAVQQLAKAKQRVKIRKVERVDGLVGIGGWEGRCTVDEAREMVELEMRAFIELKEFKKAGESLELLRKAGIQLSPSLTNLVNTYKNQLVSTPPTLSPKSPTKPSTSTGTTTAPPSKDHTTPILLHLPHNPHRARELYTTTLRSLPTFQPTRTLLHAFLNAYTHPQDPEGMEFVRAEMQAFHIQPDAETYTYLLRPLARQGKWVDVSELFESFFGSGKVGGVRPTGGVYTMLVMEALKRGEVLKALKWIQDAQKRRGGGVGLGTGVRVRMGVEMGEVDRAVEVLKKQDVDEGGYVAVMRSLAARGDVGGLREVMNVWRDQKMEGERVGSEVGREYVVGLCGCGFKEEAMAFAEEVGIEADKDILRIFLQYADPEEEIRMMARLKTMGFNEEELRVHLLANLLRRGEHQKAMDVWERHYAPSWSMAKAPFSLNGAMTILKACKGLDVATATRWFKFVFPPYSKTRNPLIWSIYFHVIAHSPGRVNISKIYRKYLAEFPLVPSVCMGMMEAYTCHPPHALNKDDPPLDFEPQDVWEIHTYMQQHSFPIHADHLSFLIQSLTPPHTPQPDFHLVQKIWKDLRNPSGHTGGEISSRAARWYLRSASSVSLDTLKDAWSELCEISESTKSAHHNARGLYVLTHEDWNLYLGLLLELGAYADCFKEMADSVEDKEGRGSWNRVSSRTLMEVCEVLEKGGHESVAESLVEQFKGVLEGVGEGLEGLRRVEMKSSVEDTL